MLALHENTSLTCKYRHKSLLLLDIWYLITVLAVIMGMAVCDFDRIQKWFILKLFFNPRIGYEAFLPIFDDIGRFPTDFWQKHRVWVVFREKGVKKKKKNRS